MLIKEYRNKLGLTQKQFSELFDPPIPVDTIKKWDSEKMEPKDWVKGLIIEKIKSKTKEGETKMNEVFSEHYKMACTDIGDNGYKILKRKKYDKIIAKTVITKFANGLGKMVWQDEKGLIIAHHTGTLDFNYYPLVGEIIEQEKEGQ